jgi:hypothetical protein
MLSPRLSDKVYNCLTMRLFYETSLLLCACVNVYFWRRCCCTTEMLSGWLALFRSGWLTSHSIKIITYNYKYTLSLLKRCFRLDRSIPGSTRHLIWQPWHGTTMSCVNPACGLVNINPGFTPLRRSNSSSHRRGRRRRRRRRRRSDINLAICQRVLPCASRAPAGGFRAAVSSVKSLKSFVYNK